ncbi:MAG: restriction endonuclease [bacterium]|nr:restriction endonuclease [bacterium]
MDEQKPKLTLDNLWESAREFAQIESSHDEPSLYGITDGKAVGSYVEKKYQRSLDAKFDCEIGNAAKGIDLPAINIDIKVTSKKQPQSSCPFSSARQKIYGLGYSLLVFVYDKTDDDANRTSKLDILHVVYVDAALTADYQTTKGILEIIENEGNEDDLVAFMADRMLPVDDIGARVLAQEILSSPPKQGYLTISNAMQWRLQYVRAIVQAGQVKGIVKVQ